VGGHGPRARRAVSPPTRGQPATPPPPCPRCSDGRVAVAANAAWPLPPTGTV